MSKTLISSTLCLCFNKFGIQWIGGVISETELNELLNECRRLGRERANMLISTLFSYLQEAEGLVLPPLLCELHCRP